MASRFWIGLVCLVLIVLVYFSQPSLAQGVATPPPTNTKRPTEVLIATSTPIYVIVTSTPLPTKAAIPALLCADCQRVRLRDTPGTAGQVLQFLEPSTPMTILARSDDSQWLQVSLADQSVTGWVAVSFVHNQNGQALDPDVIEGLPVYGVAVQAPPTATSNLNIPSWLSGIDSHTHEIYLKGQQLGNRANVFAKVGDSMTFSPYFLTPFGSGQYDLGNYGDLGDVVAYYSSATARTGNSFTDQSLAAGGGWSSFTVMIPGYLKNPLCDKDSPLVCEYKQLKPAVALIMVGTNDSGSGSTGPFKSSLDQIIQTSIDMGVIPVISTIPPKTINDDQAARVDAFNQVIHSTAAQFDIPLWDYYSEMVKLPNKGMGSDGLHASVPPGGASGVFNDTNLQYGYTLRNLMALQVLDTIKRLVMN